MWKETEQYICYTKGNLGNLEGKKIASFDLDDTVIKTKSGKRFSKEANDWMFHNGMDKKIKDFHKDGYTIVIISNQKGTNAKDDKLKGWKTKVEAVVNRLGIPVVVYAAFQNDQYRKPRTGLWDEFIKGDVSTSFYCGDAGGRDKRRIDGKMIARDFSDSDLKFALNVGMRFIHRDELVYGVEYKKFHVHHPIKFDQKVKEHTFVPKNKELIINVGFAGCGKSSYTKKHVLPHGYGYVNQDTLKTGAKCLKECERLMKEGKSVIIDNTNPDPTTRKKYLDLAKTYGMSTRCLWFTATMEQALHNNCYRSIVGGNPMVPKIAYNIYKKKFVEPTKKEGFTAVEKVPFVVDSSLVTMEKYKKHYI